MQDLDRSLKELGFLKKNKADGSQIFLLFPGRQNKAFWTQISVKSVGDAWQVTYSRSESQVGIWRAHKIVKKIEVHVHSSLEKLISEISEQKAKTPDLLRRLCS
tara:strand:- start:341 stop:652 length:312 start_codon:yes stop_codon:yes gene_type:complete